MKVVQSILLILLLVGAIAAQAAAQWKRFVWDDDKISFEMPSSIRYVYDKDGFAYQRMEGQTFAFQDVHLLNASDEDTYMSLERYRVNSPKDFMNELLRSGDVKRKNVAVGNAQMKIVEVRYEGLDKYRREALDFAARYLLTKNHLYIATVWRRGKPSAASERFLNSISANVASDRDPSRGVESVSLSQVKPQKITDISGSIREVEAKLLVDQVAGDEKGGMLFLHRPWAGNYEPTNNQVSKGTVRLLVAFGRDGYVEKVQLISGVQGNANRNALFSVLRTKFLPKLVNGATTDSIREVTYRF